MSNKTVWINARFLGRSVTGVERVAWQIINNLATRHLDKNACWTSSGTTYRFRLVAPHGIEATSPWPNLPLEKIGFLKGHAWEQFELPIITRGCMLLSLCNTGPIVKKDHVVFLHDAQPFAIPENFSFSFRLWYCFMFYCLARTSSRVLVNSKFTLEELFRYIGLNTAKADLCYLGNEHVQHNDTDIDPLGRFNLPSGNFVLAVSSANRNKNFKSVVNALELLGDDAPPCVIVGKMNQTHFGESTVDFDKVTHLDYVTDEELFALYGRAMCLVFPSFYEGFGLPPLEAMTLGCPVIVSRTSSLIEIGGNAATYCDPANPQTLANAIRMLSVSKETRAQLGLKGLQRARDFSWARSALVVLESIERSNLETCRVRAGHRESLDAPTATTEGITAPKGRFNESAKL